MAFRATLRRYHVWLGWLVGVPVLIWTISGLVMVMKPIDEVRGAKLIAAPSPIATLTKTVAPNIDGRPISSLKLEQHSDGPRWVISFADGGTRLADPGTGHLLPKLSAADAAREVASRYTGHAKIVSTTRTDAQKPPIELRRPLETWRVAMSDDTHFYVDAGSGEIVARRTGWWRTYDFFWGLHIMDLQGREDTNNPWVVTFGALSALMAVLAVVLLFLTGRKRRTVTKQRGDI
nr:PepSY domain-containing protein [uncultured Sphingomonas sp.]